MNVVPPIPVNPNLNKNVITSDLPSSIRDAKLSPKNVGYKYNRVGPEWEGRAKALSELEQQYDVNTKSDPLRMMMNHINQDSRDLTSLSSPHQRFRTQLNIQSSQSQNLNDNMQSDPGSEDHYNQILQAQNRQFTLQKSKSKLHYSGKNL